MLNPIELKVLVIDNNDSFTYNLVQILSESELCEYKVVQKNRYDFTLVEDFDKILISPGPGLPEPDALLVRTIKRFAPYKSMLGVCFGHQAIGIAFGSVLVQLENILHGEGSKMILGENSDYIFDGLDSGFVAARYHSWLIDPDSIKNELLVTSRDELGNIMSIKHRHYDVHGLQYHPESYLSKRGPEIVINWLKGE